MTKRRERERERERKGGEKIDEAYFPSIAEFGIVPSLL
jgi:hypothetical protein